MLKDKSKMKQASSSMLNYNESIFPPEPREEKVQDTK